MNPDLLLRRIKALQAQNELIANTLMVLEKEVAGGGAPSTSNKLKNVEEKVTRFTERRKARRRIKKPSGN